MENDKDKSDKLILKAHRKRDITITLRIPEETDDKLYEICNQTELSRNGLLNRIIEFGLDRIIIE